MKPSRSLFSIHPFRAAASVTLAGLLAGGPGPLEAQDVEPLPPEEWPEEAERVRILEFVRIQGEEPSLDGTLTHPAWESAATATDFVQLAPDEGAPPAEPTEALVLFGREALYVGFRARDSAPDSIVGLLTRRNEASPSDWVGVLVDSYHDRRTGFAFMVNPAGVQRDVLFYDDGREDDDWEAVWESEVRVGPEGWTAELRIPYSQLRFGSGAGRTWGVNFLRETARHQETSTWSPLSRETNAVVSRSGIIRGVEALDPPRRVEVRPYSAAGLTRAPGDPEDPFHAPSAGTLDGGVDVKVGLGPNLTFDATVNPDFGQVEADPAQVNLSAFETFFPERRPFFLEGANIFRFGIGLGDNRAETLFHSRRIGRSPQGTVRDEAEWADEPEQSRILAAGKLSGRTDGGWSLGLLNAVTAREEAAFATEDGFTGRDVVEPRTNYSVARVERDLNEGRTTFGSVFTGTFREGDPAAGLELPDRALTGGLDASHRFGDDRYLLRGFLVGSHVAGSSTSMEQLQRAPARYFHRPDAGHLELDPERTSLSGHSGDLELSKTGGAWRGGILTQWRSPGFEANDLGFMGSADYLANALYAGYVETNPGDRLRQWSVFANAWGTTTFGGERTELGGNVNGDVQLRSGRSVWGGIRYAAPAASPVALRGGPALRTEEEVGGWLGFAGDSRQDLQLRTNVDWGLRPESDSWNLRVAPTLRWRPTPGTRVELGPFASRNVDDRQWVTRLSAGEERHPILGRLRQTTVGMDVRADVALAPDLTLQVYAQPFLSSGSYRGLRTVEAPQARSYEDRLRTLEVRDGPDGELEVDVEGDGTFRGIDDPDFGIRELQTNAVLRWRFRPGSTLFLVWSQARSDEIADGRFQLRDGVSDLLGSRAENTFMIKVSYWLDP